METYSYVYIGSRLTQETITTVTTTDEGTETTTNTLDYFYGVNGPASVNWNGAEYYYLTNAQGDIVALLDESGNFVVQYSYDAWGNPLSTTGSMAETLGSRNSLRYRGYVFDDETGLYYLQSRYYDPEICRFINADAYIATGQGLLGNNMFAYCLNNPANFVDRTGTDALSVAEWWIGGASWLPAADAVLPYGDIIYVGGSVILLAIALASSQDSVPQVSFDYATSSYSPPSPDNDDDDDYYDDDDNFTGREKVGKSKGKTPRNNRVQNKQFKDATKGLLNKDQQRALHDDISGKGYGFHDLVDEAKNYMFFFYIFLYDQDD